MSTVHEIAALLPDPAELRSHLRALAVRRTGTAIEFPPGRDDPDGSGFPFPLLTDRSAEAARAHFEDCYERHVPLEAVRHVLAGQPLTAALATTLNPTALADDALLRRIAAHPEAAAYLECDGEFDLARTDVIEPIALPPRPATASSLPYGSRRPRCRRSWTVSWRQRPGRWRTGSCRMSRARTGAGSSLCSRRPAEDVARRGGCRRPATTVPRTGSMRPVGLNSLAGKPTRELALFRTACPPRRMCKTRPAKTKAFRFGDADPRCAPGGSHPATVTGHNRRGRIRMAAVEYTPKRRNWVRDVLVGITASFGSNLMWALAQAVVHRLG